LTLLSSVYNKAICQIHPDCSCFFDGIKNTIINIVQSLKNASVKPFFDVKKSKAGNILVKKAFFVMKKICKYRICMYFKSYRCGKFRQWCRFLP